MNWIKKLFNKKKEKQCAIHNVSSCFSIEYYPLTDRYYPKYEKYYLKTNENTGIVEKKEDYLFSFADYGKTEEEANKLIELFKEQWLKKNVKTIKVNGF
ncbi:MAG: hypothetical protein PHW15_03310 [Patescibacteria group bacterium]|nr:hypothetical protein [Patescibacteria group bacterium]